MNRAVLSVVFILLLTGTSVLSSSLQPALSTVQENVRGRAVINLQEKTGTDPSPLIDGVSSICAVGVPGPLWAWNDNPVPVVSGDEDTTPVPSIVVMSSCVGSGRVVAVGHEGFFTSEALGLYDNRRLGNNILDWLDKSGKPKVLVTTGHREFFSGSNFDAFKTELESHGYNISRFSGRLAASNLYDVGAVLIGNAGNPILQSEIDALKDFVSSGGGLFLIGLGWSWEPYNPGKTLDDYPMNKIGEVFRIRWINGYISDQTNNLNGQPIFHTFYPNIEIQTIYQALSYINITTDAHPSDLPFFLQNNGSAREKYVKAHLLLATASTELSQGSSQLQDIYTYYRNLTSSYPQYFQRNIVYDTISQSTMAWIRERVYRTFINTLIYGTGLTADKKAEVAAATGLTGKYLDIWNRFSVLLLDNTRLKERQKEFIYNLLDLIPEDLYNLHSISVIDNLGKLPSPTPGITLWGKDDGVNIFNMDIGEIIGANEFPSDVSPRYSDSFCVVTVHEVNHVVDAYRVSRDSALQDRKMDLIRRADNTSLNYLRSSIMPTSDFFTNAPQEFFASISNEGFIDSFLTLQLGLRRFLNGYTEPINQFLFFADVYSQGLNQTIFYSMDTQGNISRRQVPLTRDSHNHINSLDYDKNTYKFDLDPEGNVLSINVSASHCIVKFEFSPDKPRPAEPVVFDASESYSLWGNITSYEWNFDDNNITTVTKPAISHVYGQPGSYNVTLTVIDNNGLWGSISSIINVRTTIHDVAVTGILPYKNVASNNTVTSINITAANQGDAIETFNVTLYANTTAIGTRTLSLTNGSSTTLTFTWNTTGFACGNYTISASATSVPSETDNTDNTLTGSSVYVGIEGDLNADGRVDMKDVSYVARRFMCISSDPLWDSVADVNGDGKIDMKDISTVARHFGERYP